MDIISLESTALLLMRYLIKVMVLDFVPFSDYIYNKKERIVPFSRPNGVIRC